MNINKLKISTRLFVLIGTMAALLIGIGAVGLIAAEQSKESLRTVYEDRTVPMGQLAEVNALNLKNRLDIAGSLLFPEEIDKNTADLDANVAHIQQVWAAYMATSLTPEEATLAKQVEESRARFLAEGLLPAAAALRSKDLEGAKRIVHEKIRALYVPVAEGLEALTKLQLDIANSEYAAAAARYSFMRTASIGVIVAGILFAVLFGWVIVRGISRQLGAEPVDVLSVTSAISSGNLSTSIVVRPGDEQSVMAGMAAMQKSLVSVVSSVRQGSEGVLTASAEIAQGNQDLSGRTESQASALEETAASMEELSSTVKQNADSARQANQLALNASMVAAKGGEVVQMVVDTMKDINDSSRRISDIISVIDGIAFQTNILALNAAVEAARAGEQGRGFAVVATEVRSLAGRSADAAKEIKNLIGASVERVEAGTALVDEAGATMSEVVSAVKRVTDLMGEISAASVEQSAGVSQVGEAVIQMDQVTQQNAALVEEMAAAAVGLKSQANDLVAAVAIFNTGIPASSTSSGLQGLRNASFKTAYLGPERRSPEFNSQKALAAHSDAKRLIQTVKKQAKVEKSVQTADTTLVASPAHADEWEAF